MIPMGERYSAYPDGETYVLVDRERHAEARVAPALGNNVTHYRVLPADMPAQYPTPVDVLLAAQSAHDLGPNGYGAGLPILFPFPNRVAGGTYTFEGREYQLDVNEPALGNHIHGLVCNRPWTVEDAGASPETGAWLRSSIQLDTFPDIARQYPFPCRLTVITRLIHGVLVQEIAVLNSGNTNLPMGYGIHPWFSAVLGGGPRAETEVRLPASSYWRLERLVPTGEKVDVDDQPGKFDLRAWHALDGNEYDDVFADVIRRDDDWIEGGIHYPYAGVEVLIEASPEFREWVLYAPNSRHVICIEPYTGTTNAVNLQSRDVDAGLVVLEPGAIWTGVIRLHARRAAPRPLVTGQPAG